MEPPDTFEAFRCLLDNQEPDASRQKVVHAHQALQALAQKESLEQPGYMIQAPLERPSAQPLSSASTWRQVDGFVPSVDDMEAVA